MSKWWLVVGGWWLVIGGAFGQEAGQIVRESQKRGESKSQQYEGTLEVTGPSSKASLKRWSFERIGSGGNSKTMLRFLAPEEVKGVAVLIIAHPGSASDQWIWTPALDRERRVAVQNRSTRFFGTDFSFEDLEERDVNQFDYKLLGEEGAAWKIETHPRKSSQYVYSFLWVKKENYTLEKLEAYTKSGLARVIEYRDYEQVKGVWTARTTEVTDIARKSRTVLKYD